MQIFIPYASPLTTAETMLKSSRRFNKQIQETRQILAAIYDPSKGYANHPVTKMYQNHTDWLKAYLKTFELVQSGNYFLATIYSLKADCCRPKWMTTELCDQHKRRLFTKNPVLYKQFSYLGTSLENWYVVNNKIVKYINGKKQ